MSTQNPGDGDQRRPEEPAEQPEWTTPELNVPEPPDLPGPSEQGPPPSGPRPGSIQRQEPGVTQPRPPTVAEARARDKARKRAAEAQRAAEAAAEAKKRTRKRVLIGGVAVVGVAGLVGGGYLAYRALTAPDEVTAYCVKNENGQELVVEDKYCTPGTAGFVDDSGGGSHGHAGPIIIYGGGPQYRYYYGGNNTIGKAPVGGSTLKPKGAQITTKSGTTIQRGGLGSKSTGGGS